MRKRAQACAAAARAANVFVARDQAFRFRRGEEGFAGIALTSDDAAEDDADYRRQGLSGGPMLTFSRPVTMPDGSGSVASFLLAFSADLRSPDFYLFTCQRKNPLPADRSALEAHANGATGLRELVFSEPAPSAFGSLLRSLLHQDTVTDLPSGLSLQAANARITVLDPAGIAARLGLRTSSHSRGLRGQAVVFSVRDLAVTEALLFANGVAFRRHEGRVLVPQAPGQGAMFVFEEKP